MGKNSREEVEDVLVARLVENDLLLQLKTRGRILAQHYGSSSYSGRNTA
jgi:hypothetical protein